jgi:signal peptidase I
MAQDDVATWVPPREPAWRRITRIGFWALIGLAVLLLVASIVSLFLITRVYSVSTPTMEHTVPAGDRVLLAPGSAIHRGDVVVLRVPVSVSDSTTVFVKRVIGLPGDHVACCDPRGRVTVNGKPLDETYLYPGDRPSRSTFSVTLGPGRIWVMGDQRSISADSRKWGPVPLSGVVGRVAVVNHGFSFTGLHTPKTFVADGLAPPDTRADAYQVLAFLVAGSLLALLVLALTGFTRYLIGQRGSPSPPAEVPASAEVPVSDEVPAPDESAPTARAARTARIARTTRKTRTTRAALTRPSPTAPADLPAPTAAAAATLLAPTVPAPAAPSVPAPSVPAPTVPAPAAPAPAPAAPVPAAPAPAAPAPAAAVPAAAAPPGATAQPAPACPPAAAAPAPSASASATPAPSASATPAPSTSAAPTAPTAPSSEGLADA